jgi:tRNA dimethylallyltransferase
MPGPRFLALVGPTASGKSDAAEAIAPHLDAEIVSVDSMLVYRGMDVGTAKPSPAVRARVPHHLVDVAEPDEPFSVARYQGLAHRAVANVEGRGRRVLLVGGSGLYFRAVVDELEIPQTDRTAREELEAEAQALGPVLLHERLSELDPVAAARIEPANVRRTVRALEVAAVTGRPFSSYAEPWARYPEDRVRAAGVELPRDALAVRIEARVRAMIDAGFVDEVRALIDRGLTRWLTAGQAIGYAELARHLQGELSLEEAMALTTRRTRELARRQMVWFRRDPRIRWFQVNQRGAVAIADELTEYLRDG